jgi:hypothetical protein
MPGPLIKLMDTGQDGPGFNFDFRPSAPLHPFLQLFRNQENTGLGTARVFTYWQAEVPNDPSVRVLNYLPVADKSGVKPTGLADPAITSHTLGDGRVIFVATTANPKWTSFPAKMAYVELMHEMISGGVRAGDYWMNLTVGQALEIPPEVKITTAPEMKDEAGVPILIDAVSEPGKPTVYRSRVLTRPGLYSLSLGLNTVPVAVNVPSDEADVRTVGNEAIRKALGDIQMSLEGDEPPPEQAAAAESNDWAAPTLMVVLCLLALECFMAMSFGHYRRAQVLRTA